MHFSYYENPVAFIETEEQFALLQREDPDELVMAVASSPMAMHLLQSGSRRHVSLNNVFDDIAARSACAKQYVRARRFCERVDELTAEVFEYAGSLERISSIALMYFLMRSFATMAVRPRQVRGVLESCKADHVVQINVPSLGPALSLSPYVQGLVTRLSAGIALQMGMTTTVMGEAGGAILPPESGHTVAQPAETGATPWLVIDEAGFEVGLVAEAWKEQTGGSVVSLDRVLASVPFEYNADLSRRLFNRLLTDETVLGAAEEQCPEVLEPILAFLAYAHMPRQVSIARHIEVFVPYAPGVLLVNSMASSILESARAGGLPSIVYQHGGSGVQENPCLDYVWRLGADFLLTYGPGVDRHFREWEYAHAMKKSDNLAKLKSVGSIQLQQLDSAWAGDGQPDTELMYINTTFGAESSFFSHHYTDFWYWGFQQRVLDILARKDGSTIIKVHPSEYVRSPLREYLKDIQASHCRVITDPLTQVAGRAKAYALDTLGTGLLQLCLTEKPILAMATEEFFPFDEHALELLEKRVELCRSAPEFLERLKTFPDESSWDRERLGNREFLNAYGYRKGSKPLEVAVDFLQSLTGK